MGRFLGLASCRFEFLHFGEKLLVLFVHLLKKLLHIDPLLRLLILKQSEVLALQLGKHFDQLEVLSLIADSLLSVVVDFRLKLQDLLLVYLVQVRVTFQTLTQTNDG